MRWLDGITDVKDESEQTLGVGDGQESMACCSPWGRKESDTTGLLNSNLYLTIILRFVQQYRDFTLMHRRENVRVVSCIKHIHITIFQNTSNK